MVESQPLKHNGSTQHFGQSQQKNQSIILPAIWREAIQLDAVLITLCLPSFGTRVGGERKRMSLYEKHRAAANGTPNL